MKLKMTNHWLLNFMKYFYEKFWVPVFGHILSKFVFLIEGKKQDSKNKKNRLITFVFIKYF